MSVLFGPAPTLHKPAGDGSSYEAPGHALRFEPNHPIFEMTDSGGIQQVIAKDPGDKEQINLIQQHLQYEAMRFSGGDFFGPASLQGSEMPGLKELSEGVTRLKVEYSPLPNSAQITFTTQDLQLVTAIHRWFGAQPSDHGADATYQAVSGSGPTH